MRVVALALAAVLLLGTVAVAKTDWASLTVKYKQVLVRYPTDPHARFSLAMVYAHEGQLLNGWRELQMIGKQLSSEQQQRFATEVVGESDRVLQRSSNDILIRYRRAFALYFLGQKDAAKMEFEKIRSEERRVGKECRL